MSEGSDTAHTGPVSNAGLVTTTNLTPASSTTVPMTGVVSHGPHPVPLLSIPTHSNGHIPTPGGVQVGTSNASDSNNTLQPKIPPLMGIRPDTFPSLPPPPPVQLPTTLPPSSGTTSHSTAAEVTGTTDGPPRMEDSQPLPQRKAQEFDHDEDSDGEDGKGEGDTLGQEDLVTFHPKLLLRLRKSGDDESFEKQDATKNDSYCWVCHDGGDVLCCDKCPRVFHIQCSGLSRAPEGDEEWYCPVCKTIARKTKRSRPANLKDLLLLAVNRMMFQGTEIFQKPVPPDIMTHYREYIFHPTDLGRIKEKVMAGEYQSTREFTHDAEWILHNCIIYNGAKHALTKIAKGIIKVCKEDMREIELCPGCYELTVKQPKDWFCTPCNPPHPVMLAKVRGYPLWPAKLISETSDKCDVRFFGQHDRSIVPKSAIQELNGLPPKPSTKTQHWNIAMLELKKYGENIEAMREKMGLSKSADKGHKSFKSKEAKLIVSRGETHQTSGQQNSNHYDQLGQRTEHLNGGGNGPYSISNHIPPSAAVVEVNPSGVDSDKTSRLVNRGSSEPSSPGSPRDLQIDLDRSRSPGKKRTSEPAGMLNAIKRNIPGSLDFNEGGSPQAVGGNLSQLSRGVKGRKAGDRLSAVLSNLTARRVANASASTVIGGQGGTVTAVNAAGLPLSGGGGASAENMDTEDSEDMNAQGQSDNPFSSIYHDRNKTAIALVDPDSHKRKRNINKRFTDQPPPAKKSKVQSSASSKPSSKESEPLLTATSAPEITVNNNSLGFVNLRPEVPSAVGSSTSVSPQSSTESPNSKGGGGKGHPHAHTQQQHQSHAGSSAGGPGFTLGMSPSKQTNATGKKKSKSKSKQSAHGRSPNKGVSKTSSTPSRALVTASSSSSSPAASATTATVNNLSHPSPSQAAAAPSSSSSSSNQESLNNLRIGVRGEEAAPGIEDDDSNDFAEGSGLFADTVRKVNQSFRARVNHLTGNNDDMGYQYFTEKLMTSVKAILTEMLSTYEAKSRLSAKQLKDQLHTCWPVPHSRVTLDQLKKELRDEMKQSLEVVRASADLEMQQVVSEVRRQAEKEKEIAIAETKRKKWCSYCLNEAQYNCCWNANYCNETCQQNHWPEHMKNCTQVQQQQQPPTSARTPGPPEVSGGTPVATAAPIQFHPSMALMSNASGGGGGGAGGAGGAPVFTSGQEAAAAAQHQHQQNLLYMARSATAARTPQGQQQGIPHQQHIGVVNQIASGSLTAVQQQQHQSTAGGEGSPASVLTGHSHGRSTISREGSHPVGSPYIQVDSVPSQQQQQQQQHAMEQHPSPSLEQSMARIEHIQNESIMISSANTASPPNHIRNMLLSHQQQQQQQQQQQANRKSPVIAGSNSLQLGHQGPPQVTAATMSALGMPTGAHMGMMENSAAAAAAAAALASAQQQQHHGLGVRNIAAEHPHTAAAIHGHGHGHSHGHGQAGAPMSPASSSSENPPSVHNPFTTWSYHQQPVIIGQDGYTGLSLHQAMQANTPTSQNQSFFKTY